jgi:hypothetical protein
MTTAS